MAPPLLIAHRETATIEELKQVSPVGSNETATRCSAIQMLLAGADRQLVCNALLVTNRALRKWTNRFNQCGVDGLIVKKRPGRMTIKLPWEEVPLLVTRTPLPYVTTPNFDGPIDRQRGFGDTTILMLFTPKLKAKGVQVGIGPTIVIPTAGDNEFTGNGGSIWRRRF